MEHIESNKENCPRPESSSKFKDLLKSYLDARTELIKKYNAKLPEWKI